MCNYINVMDFSCITDAFVSQRIGRIWPHSVCIYNYIIAHLSQCREINMNALGDDYVSFVPRHISFSPDGQFILISTGKSMTMQVYLHLQVYTCT